MGIGTFGAFSQARLAIYAAQTGLTVTGNNISNINTPGYTRQRLNQVSLNTAGSDRYYARGDIRAGQGVLVNSISQIRSPYLDIRFREANAKVGYMNAKLEGLDAIAKILDEVGKGVDDDEGFGILGLEIGNLVSALQDLAKETGHQEYDNIVRQVASNLVSRLNSYASRLEQVYQDTVTDFKQDVDQVNGLLNSIRSLNEEIRRSEIHGDPALELRDERNNLIDELSGLIDISVTYDEEYIAAGVTVERLIIRLGNANPDEQIETDESLLVDGVYAAQLGRPMWNPHFGMEEDSEEWNELAKQLKAEDPGITDGDLEQLLKAYADCRYLRQKADGSTMPVADIKDATIRTDGEDNSNFDLVITALKNKNGDLHQTLVRGVATKIEDDIEDIEIVIGKNADGSDKTEKLSELLKKADSYTDETRDPSTGDMVVTIYKRVLDANGKPVLDKAGNEVYTKQVYRKVASKPVVLHDNDLGGELQAERELLTEKGEFTDTNVLDSIDENAAGKRGVQYYQNALDLLAKQLAQIFNEANQGFLMDPKGNYITRGTNDAGEEIAVPVTVGGHTLKKSDEFDSLDPGVRDEILQEVGLGTGLDEAALKAMGLTGKDVISAYLKGQTYDTTDPGSPKLKEEPTKDPKGIFAGGILFSNGNNSNDPTGITASNISISKDWLTQHILVRSFTCPEGSTEPASGQSDNIEHMKYLLDDQKWDFYPNTLEGTGGASKEPMFRGTIFEMWNQVGSTLGKDQKFTNTELTVAYETALSIDTDRDSVSSVDFNDEAMNLMMYAKSYNAACRLMTTIDSVLDKLINNTGMTT